MTLETSTETIIDTAAGTSPAGILRDRCGDFVHLPGDPSYDAVRMPWNVAIDQRPAAVAVPRTPEQVADVVAAAAAAGLRVAPQGTGHGASPFEGVDLDGVVLLRTTEMRGVSVDPATLTARVEAGALWQDVVEAAAPHGLAALHGSSPDVGVVGYSLGGGIGWYARKLGMATNSITAVEVVTADGRLVRADADHHTDLFWAVRGGGGSFGVVTALEFRLYPVADAYAGMMLWDIAHAETVLRHWAQWAVTAPEEITTSYRIMRFPPMPELPDFLRGRQVVVVDGAVLGDDELGESLVAGFRDLSPELDTWARVPAASLSRLHMDPEGPTPSVGGGLLVETLDEATVDAFLATVGAGTPTSLLVCELRQLGGALARPADDAGALPRLHAQAAGFFVGIAATPEMAAAGNADVDRVLAALAPHSGGRTFLNLAERAVDPATGYEATAWQRLQAVRAELDPSGLFLANHPVA